MGSDDSILIQNPDFATVKTPTPRNSGENAPEKEQYSIIRIGIAGIGFIAEEYIRLINGGAIHGTLITALSSRNAAHMEEIKEKYHLTDASHYNQSVPY